MSLFPKSFKNIEYKENILECGNIRVFVYVPTPPPLLRGGIAELVLRRAAYLPVSRIKPSRSAAVCASVFTRLSCLRRSP